MSVLRAALRIAGEHYPELLPVSTAPDLFMCVFCEMWICSAVAEAVAGCFSSQRLAVFFGLQSFSAVGPQEDQRCLSIRQDYSS